MASASNRSGGDFLAKRSDITRLRQDLPVLKEILVVDDETFDADRLQATLRVLLGYDIELRRAATVATAVDAVLARMPELVFLDDCLKPSDTANDSIPFIRRAGFAGPIVVVSGQVNRSRRQALVEIGATEVIHKDDVDSVRLAEAMLRIYAPATVSASLTK